MAAIYYRCTAILLALVALTGPSSGGVVDVVRDWNLLGTWATDCVKPPAPQNVHATYVQRDAAVFLDRDAGSNSDSLVITDATAHANGAISIVIAFGRKQMRTNVLTRGADGRIRAIANHDSKGRFSVRDGVVLGPKQPTQWQERCAP